MEKEMATHPSILAWKIPRSEEPGGLQYMGLQKSETRLSDWTTTSNERTHFEAQKQNLYIWHK